MSMTRKEKNEAIAKILGFKKHPVRPNSGISTPQWSYPDDWYDEIRGIPNTEVPDFIQMIDDCREIANKYKYGFPRIHEKSELFQESKSTTR